MDPLLRSFKKRLFLAKLATGTITKYLHTVHEGLEAGDMLAPLRRAVNEGHLSVLPVTRNALLHWARCSKDADLERRILDFEAPESRTRKHIKPILTVAGRTRIIDWSADHLPLTVHGIVVLLAYSGQRPGALVTADRNEVRGLRAQLPEALGALLGPLLRSNWDRLYAVLSPRGLTADAAYANLRRIIQRSADDLGIPRFPLEDFRRLRPPAA